MAGFPDDFTPDLRRLKSWPSMEDSLWRQPYLVDLTYGETYRLVNEFVVGSRLKILDVGCGTGFLSLEMAREGHDVLGLDLSEEMVKLAKKTMETDPYRSESGRLDYKVADFTHWTGSGQEFDLIIVSRSIHHIPQPKKTLSKVWDLLREGGRLVCIEFAYDQFDRRTATWLYQIRKILERTGWYRSDRLLSEDAESSVNQIMNEWLEEYTKDHTNRFEEMRKPLYQLFREEHFSWEPYLYWDIIRDIRAGSNDSEIALARLISGTEKMLIQAREIKPVLFCFVGARTRK